MGACFLRPWAIFHRCQTATSTEAGNQSAWTSCGRVRCLSHPYGSPTASAASHRRRHIAAILLAALLQAVTPRLRGTSASRFHTPRNCVPMRAARKPRQILSGAQLVECSRGTQATCPMHRRTLGAAMWAESSRRQLSMAYQRTSAINATTASMRHVWSRNPRARLPAGLRRAWPPARLLATQATYPATIWEPLEPPTGTVTIGRPHPHRTVGGAGPHHRPLIVTSRGSRRVQVRGSGCLQDSEARHLVWQTWTSTHRAGHDSAPGLGWAGLHWTALDWT